MDQFDAYKTNVSLGDVAIIYFSHFNSQALYVKEDQTTQTRFGAIRHNELIGHAYGTRFQCTKGWVYILAPTAELWTKCLNHRTQILYTTDIAMIVFQLGLKPGSVVCESGTGSGSLSHSILRTIAPSGHLHTVEFHEKRSVQAREEFNLHGYENNCTVYNHDVTAKGFPVTNAADAVFLDIPNPHLAVQHAMNALKKSGSRFCSFSPCMEQVQRTCELLHEPARGFSEIITIELVNNSYNVKRINMPIANLGNPAADHTDASWPYKVGDHLTVGEVTARNEFAPMESSNGKQQQLDKSYTPPAMADKTYTARVCTQPKEISGHTGYLTFATYCPDALVSPEVVVAARAERAAALVKAKEEVAAEAMVDLTAVIVADG